MTETTTTNFVGDLSGLSGRVNMLQRMQPEFYREEVDKVFRRGWLLVACASDIPEKNDYLCREIPTLKTSVIIARSEDGTVRVFHNMCRHRANRLVPDGQGNARAFICGFHGWSYHNDGRLAGITDRSQFTDIDEVTLDLIPVHTEVWEDFIFINFDKEPRETLEEWLGSMYGEYRGYFANRRKISSHRILAECNWNVAINSFTEGYHAMFVHKATVPDYQGGSGNPDRHRPYMEVMNYHGRYSVEGNADHKPTEVEAIAYQRGREMYPTFPPNAAVELGLPPGVNATRIKDWLHDVGEVFPNIMLVCSAHWHSLAWFWPIAVDQTIVHAEMFAYEPVTVDDHMAQTYFRTRLREVFREDVAVMEAVTQQLQSGAMEDIHLSKQEMLLQKHYASVDELIAQP